ncbi:MAG: murD [Rickettsiaceae bacterium]|jgi:UDP-N-acetylmuramoylalanine--D-glutamate ligase|nr:murD [Rickettsiaceae bacterium]
MILTKQKNKNIGIFGLGKTGLSAYDALKEVASVICFDDSEDSRNSFLKLHPEGQVVPIDNEKWVELDKIILSPNIPLEFPKKHLLVSLAEKYNITISSDMELLHEEFPSTPFIGITGTNGKSTTTALIGHILQNCAKPYQVGGNIGQACLTLDEPKNDAGYVLELSSYQIDLLQNFHLKVAVLLNITADHIDRHGTFDNYVKAKKRIFSFLEDHGTAVLAIDNNCTKETYYELVSSDKPFNIVPVSVSEILDIGVYLEYKDGERFICDNFFNKGSKIELKANKYLQGNHNYENILVSFAVAKSIGCKDSEIICAINDFQGLPHRMQFIAECNNIRFYNDSKATNAESAAKSLTSLENIYWLAGGLPKEGGIESLIYLKDRVRKAYLFGQAAQEFALTLKGKIEYIICDNITEAFEASVRDAEMDNFAKSKNILLAPACASWDQFKNFEERGHKFIELVKNYINLVGKK